MHRIGANRACKQAFVPYLRHLRWQPCLICGNVAYSRAAAPEMQQSRVRRQLRRRASMWCMTRWAGPPSWSR